MIWCLSSKCSVQESKMVARNIASVLPTKNASSNVIGKILNGGELDVSYLATLNGATIIIGDPSIELQQIGRASCRERV